ncbi:MAG: LytTR family DNA-binding domain-containing protein [Bacteroidota bacterium]
MPAIHCIILEDSLPDMELMVHYVSTHPGLQLLRTFEHPLEAISYIQEQNPPLIFMDIDMPVINGVELFKKLDYGPICVFVTAHSSYALESYEVHGFDFILKPVTPQRFNESIARVTEYMEVKAKAELYDASFEGHGILLKEGTTSHRVELKDILYVEALKDYTKVVTKTRKYITLSKLKHFMDKLPSSDFIRIHRSYGIAKNKIEKMSREELTIHNTLLPIGKTYRQELRQVLG